VLKALRPTKFKASIKVGLKSEEDANIFIKNYGVKIKKR
jgi:hypothetical protein